MPHPNGTVTFEAGGKSRSLRFTTNALCMLEEKLDMRVMMIGAEIDVGISATTLRAMIWAGLGESDVTLAAAGDIIDELGVRKAREIAVKAFEAALAEQEENGGSADADPR